MKSKLHLPTAAIVLAGTVLANLTLFGQDRPRAQAPLEAQLAQHQKNQQELQQVLMTRPAMPPQSWQGGKAPREQVANTMAIMQ